MNTRIGVTGTRQSVQWNVLRDRAPARGVVQAHAQDNGQKKGTRVPTGSGQLRKPVLAVAGKKEPRKVDAIVEVADSRRDAGRRREVKYQELAGAVFFFAPAAAERRATA